VMTDLAKVFGGTATALPPTGRIGEIDATLEGGPVDLPRELRSCRVSRSQDKVKIAYLGGYEHFERDPAVATDSPAAVYRWIGRTRVAE